MRRRQPPCAVPGGCPDRWVTATDRCHSTCKRFADWEAEQEAEKLAIKAKLKEDADVRIAHKRKIREKKKHE